MSIQPRIIAFYLPQYHPIPENDNWWGKGFTEWTNVGKAKPLFKGHDQPRVPTELGYYDLRLPSVREEQVKLAKEAGVEGFMYWHYWFGNGKTLMADIFRDVLKSGKPDFPFSLGWANHSWYSKLWNKDGKSTNKLLIEQLYPGIDDARTYFNTLLPAFLDHRYIKINGRPIFYIFDPKTLPIDYLNWFDTWAKDAGLPGIYFVANIVDNSSKDTYINKGYNAVTYQRLSSSTPKILDKYGRYGLYLNKLLKKAIGIIKHRPPRMEDYKIACKNLVQDIDKDEDVIPTLLPQWDHTPRAGWNGLLLVNSTPKLFKEHALTVFNTLKDKDCDKQLVFLKSWNEWGEGNYMEPDLTNGRGYIEALSQALQQVKYIDSYE